MVPGSRTSYLVSGRVTATGCARKSEMFGFDFAPDLVRILPHSLHNLTIRSLSSFFSVSALSRAMRRLAGSSVVTGSERSLWRKCGSTRFWMSLTLEAPPAIAWQISASSRCWPVGSRFSSPRLTISFKNSTGGGGSRKQKPGDSTMRKRRRSY
jgi:hypothetical protein